MNRVLRQLFIPTWFIHPAVPYKLQQSLQTFQNQGLNENNISTNRQAEVFVLFYATKHVRGLTVFRNLNLFWQPWTIILSY